MGRCAYTFDRQSCNYKAWAKSVRQSAKGNAFMEFLDHPMDEAIQALALRKSPWRGRDDAERKVADEEHLVKVFLVSPALVREDRPGGCDKPREGHPSQLPASDG